MKKILIIFFISAYYTIEVSAQYVKEAEVPSSVKVAFNKKYPHTQAKWEKEKDNYEVNFKKDNKTMSAVIDEEGTIIETEADIAINELPEKARRYVKASYQKAKVKEAAKIVKANGKINYEAEVNGKDVIFDNNGKFIRETAD